MANQNGQIPRKIVFRGTPSAMPFTTKTFTPTGGEISPISSAMTIITPNQIMLTPSGSMIG